MVAQTAHHSTTPAPSDGSEGTGVRKASLRPRVGTELCYGVDAEVSMNSTVSLAPEPRVTLSGPSGDRVKL